MPLQEQRMNVFTESELVIFLQVGSSNKGPSVGFVEVRGTPGDPVILYFYCNYSVLSACFEESTKTLEKKSLVSDSDY